MSQKWFMAGTEGTGQYVVYAATPSGRIGVRQLGGSSARVRVEPVPGFGEGVIAGLLTRVAGWKQPGDGGQFRFSRVVCGEADLHKAVRSGLVAIGASGADWNPQAPGWAHEFVGLEPATSPRHTPIPLAPSVPVVVAPTPKVEGSDPAAMRAEAKLLREEAVELRRQAKAAGEKASELEATATAYEQRAGEIERALAALGQATQRVKALGIGTQSVPTGLKQGLSSLPKTALLGIAEAMGVEVGKRPTKATIVAAILGA